MREQLLFIPLPAGVDREQRARLSLLVLPRLTWDDREGPETRRFGDLHAAFERWPDIVDAFEFDQWRAVVEDTAGTEVTRVRVTPRFKGVDRTLWKALFHSQVPVRRWPNEAPPPRPLVAPDLSALHGWLRAAHEAIVGANPTEPPAAWSTDADGTAQPNRSLVPTLTTRRDGRSQWLSDRLAASKDGLVTAIDPEDLEEAGYGSSGGIDRQHPDYLGPQLDLALAIQEERSSAPRFGTKGHDLHQRVGLLGDHPTVLRRVGLSLDFELDELGRTRLPSGPLFVRMELPWTDRSRIDRPVLRTAFSAAQGRGGRGFRPLPENPGGVLEPGYLKLNRTEMFEPCVVDVEGAVRDFATLDQLIDGLPDDPADIADTLADVPALHTAGLSVLWRGRGVFESARAARAASIETQLKTASRADDEDGERGRLPVARRPVTLWAEDTFRGLRIDVADVADDSLRSLCARTGAARDRSERVLTTVSAEEGFVSPMRTRVTGQRPDGTEIDYDLLSERMATWTGWSLVAARPGPHISPDDGSVTAPSFSAPLGIAIDYRVQPSTLPRLRFGHSYRLRARTVDLSGNSIELDEGDRTSMTAPIPYLRFDPVPPSVLVPPLPAERGDGAERLVIRTYNDGPSEQLTNAVAKTTARSAWLAPPTASAHLVELHGVLDPPSSLDPTARQDWFSHTWSILASREQALPEGVEEGQALSLTHYLPDPLARSSALHPQGDAPTPGGGVQTLPFPIIDAERAAALGVPFRGAIDMPGDRSFEVDRLPARIQLHAGQLEQRDASFDAPSNRFDVTLPPGREARYTMAAVPEVAEAEQLGAWSWIEQAPTNSIKIESFARGELWAVTPPADLVLVHAVQRPISAPQIAVPPPDRDGHVTPQPQITRSIGSTAATLTGGYDDVDIPSTGVLTLQATWSEPVYDPDTDGGVRWESREHTAVMRRLPEGAFGTSTQPFASTDTVVEAWGDTRHRRVRYRGIATSRFVGDFPRNAGLDFRTVGPRGAVVNLPATRRPDPPQIAAVVPAFGWDGDPGTPGGRTRRAGVRVYLAGPWYSSGEDEQLAIVLRRGNDPDLRTSRWGSDPTVTTTGPSSSFLSSAQLPERLNQRSSTPPGWWDIEPLETLGLLLPDDDGRSVDVVLFEVQWDPQRRQFFADVALELPASYYRPLLRLSVARYQHYCVNGHGVALTDDQRTALRDSTGLSRTNLALSSAVVADFVSLSPERTASVVRAVDGGLHWTIEVRATRSSGQPTASRERNAVIVSAQRKRSNDDELLWETAPDVTSALDVAFNPDGSLAMGLLREESPSGSTLWRGTLEFPPGFDPSRYRLIVREVEEHDAFSPSGLRGTGQLPVYLDVVPLS
ncbi:MAG: hypothetical protein AAF799_46375 [Myxococcota bacterium]